jgi:DNA-binding NtrC family response regulator
MLDVLVVDDDRDVRETVSEALVAAGHRVAVAADGVEAMGLAAAHVFDLAVCDVQMPRLDGLTLFRRLKRESPTTAVVIMTSFGNVPDVVEVLREGATDYVTKPFDPEDFARRVVEPIAEHRALRKRFDEERDRFVATSTGATLVTVSPPMRSLASRIALLAGSDASVVVTGEAGVGKELVARTLHAQGPRRDGPLVVVADGRLPSFVAEDRSTFTAQGEPHPLLRAAMGGTLVLRGVEDLAPRLQTQLNGLLSVRSVQARRDPTGAPLGVRLVTLMRRRLADGEPPAAPLPPLHYRLAGTLMHVPSLAQRGDDLLPLVTTLLRELVPPSKTVPSFTASAWRLVAAHPFSHGNVRELRWALEHALAMCDGGPIAAEHLPAELQDRAPDVTGA